MRSRTSDPADLLAVVEAVSTTNPDNDYKGKVRDYAAMGIPVHLIVDPREGNGLVLSQPHQTPEGVR